MRFSRTGGFRLAPIVTATLLCGCAGTTLTNTQQLDAMQSLQNQTLRELETMKEAQEASREAAVDARAEMALVLEDLEARLDRVENQLRDLLDGLSRVQEAAHPATDPGPVSGPVSDPRPQYEAAYLEVTRGHYDLAISGFEDFLRGYPQDDLSDNAVYWIGECFYVQRQFNRAIEAFVRLIDTYPRGDKVPGALLKLGYAFAESGDDDAARRYLEAVIKQYPGSEEAGKAQARMARLD